jgi:hypothetical protein
LERQEIYRIASELFVKNNHLNDLDPNMHGLMISILEIENLTMQMSLSPASQCPRLYKQKQNTHQQEFEAQLFLCSFIGSVGSHCVPLDVGPACGTALHDGISAWTHQPSDSLATNLI